MRRAERDKKLLEKFDAVAGRVLGLKKRT